MSEEKEYLVDSADRAVQRVAMAAAAATATTIIDDDDADADAGDLTWDKNEYNINEEDKQTEMKSKSNDESSTTDKWNIEEKLKAIKIKNKRASGIFAEVTNCIYNDNLNLNLGINDNYNTEEDINLKRGELR